MKLIDIIKTANQNLLRNKVRTILTILAIFVGSFTIILSGALNEGVSSFIEQQVENVGGEGWLVIASNSTMESFADTITAFQSDEIREYNPSDYSLLATALTDEQIEQLKNLDGINPDSIQTLKMPTVDYITSSTTDKKYVVSLETVPPGNFNIDIVAGRRPNNQSDDYEIILQPGYSKVLGFESDEAAIGKNVTLATRDFVTQKFVDFTATVVGVQANSIVSMGTSYVNTALGDAIYAENVRYYPEDQKNLIMMVQAEYDYEKYTEDEIKEKLYDAGFAGRTVSDFVGSVQTFFDIVMTVFSLFGGIALIAAAIGIINTLFMSVEERTREIGLDKALGMSSGKVFLSFSFEAISLGFWGSVFGITLAMVIGYTADAIFHAAGGFLEAFPTFAIVKFTFPNLLGVTILIMFIAFLSGTIPALKAAHKNPIDALRYE